jgi:hypothetical protein
MEQSTNRLIPGRARRDRALLTWRNVGALGLFLYGTTFLWLTSAFAGTAKPTGGTAWTVTHILVVLTVLGFSVAAWGIYKATSWRERAASGSAIFGFVPLIPYWVAAHAAVGAANAAQGVAIHAVGNTIVLILLLAPPLKHWIKGQVEGAKR